MRCLFFFSLKLFPSKEKKGKELAAVNETHHHFLPAPGNLLPLLMLFSRMLLWLIRKYILTPSLPELIWGFFSPITMSLGFFILEFRNRKDITDKLGLPPYYIIIHLPFSNALSICLLALYTDRDSPVPMTS